jgi:hypothetical protein
VGMSVRHAETLRPPTGASRDYGIGAHGRATRVLR